MQYVYYTLAAIILYFLSDWILVKIEQKRGEPFKQQRSLVFLIIIMVLALSTFKAIELLVNP
jgi:predicted PurR-regulated permease PerM